MKNLDEYRFHRKFSASFLKNLSFPLAEMSFTRDFSRTKRGDIYPQVGVYKACDSDAACEESVVRGKYHARCAERFFAAHFPFATYEVSFDSLDGMSGFVIYTKDGAAELFLENRNGEIFIFSDGESFPVGERFESGVSLIVTSRGESAEFYIRHTDGAISFVSETKPRACCRIRQSEIYGSAYVTFAVRGECTVSEVKSCMDCGLAQADIRPVLYENGEVILEDGKIFFTLTARMHQSEYQAVVSWTPGTMDFALVGAIFFDYGDGILSNDVAASLKYDRGRKKWILWACSFSHGHILASCESDGDFRFGVNIADMKLTDTAGKDENKELFLGFSGDEDPDLIYNDEDCLWYFAVCRMTDSGYRYFFFTGSDPLNPTLYIGKGAVGEETGGSFVKHNGELCFVCGNSFSSRAEYRIYKMRDITESAKSGAEPKFTLMKHDFDDGGFRGWGSVFAVKKGTREHLYHMTFDRANASEYNWSYGNLYSFEAE